MTPPYIYIYPMQFTLIPFYVGRSSWSVGCYKVRYMYLDTKFKCDIMNGKFFLPSNYILIFFKNWVPHSRIECLFLNMSCSQAVQTNWISRDNLSTQPGRRCYKTDDIQKYVYNPYFLPLILCFLYEISLCCRFKSHYICLRFLSWIWIIDGNVRKRRYLPHFFE